MSARLESFLAKIYVDSKFRAKFLNDPIGEATKAGLNVAECKALEKIDREGLYLAAASFERKRQKKNFRKNWFSGIS